MHKGEKDKRIEHELERKNTYVLELLRDKRRLNTELENERKLSRKLKEECHDLRRRLGEQQAAGRGQDSFTSFNSLLQTSENSAVDLKEKICALENSLRESRAQIISLEEHKALLETEILRLAEALAKDNSSSSDMQLYIEQLNIYENDFQKERNEKEKAETKVSALTDQISDCQELISTLTREVDLYKNAFEREKKDKESVLRKERGEGTIELPPIHSQASSLPLNFPGSDFDQGLALPTTHQPHLQVVYPLVDSRIQNQESKRKRELHRRGVLVRSTPESSGGLNDS
ncbi:protein Hook homolog 3-like [Montipora capricornis]|uniref:protein Hook homolog 3-like n=1 Tax=Montipora foliosa TaxID=591990 RepID=UPI0035F1C79D